MNRNVMKHGLTLGLAAIMALGAVGVASAKTRAKDFVGVWQLDARNGDGSNHGGGYSGRQGDWGDSRGGNDYGNGNDRRGSGQGYRGSQDFGALPATFRIDRDRRELQVESMDGRLLREMNSAGNRQLTSQRRFLGTTIIERYSLSDNGRRLVIRTSIQGPRGSREMTNVYERA
jgi:hypothetical protein